MSLHGWLMWISWTVFGMAQIILNRYYKHMWMWNQFLHNALGLSAGVLTIVAFITIMISKNWNMSFHDIRHSSFGIISTALCLLLIIGGIFAWLKRSRGNEW
jgi:L-asparagine transporter-like permease